LDPDPNPFYGSFPFLQALPALDTGFLAAGLVVFVLLLLASALFSGSEVALFSLKGSDREALAARGEPGDLRVLHLLEHPRQLLITILILNTSVNVAAAILAAVMTHEVARFYRLQLGPTFFLEVIVLTFVLLVVSEITPKLIAARHAHGISRAVARVILVLHRLFFPLTSFITRSLQGLQRRITRQPQRISPDDLKRMAEIGEAHGTLREEERELIHSIVEFGEMTVREIMVSRVDMTALATDAPLDEALALIRTSGHSRLPLFTDHLDNIAGVLYAKDLLPFLTQEAPPTFDLATLARPAMYVPLTKKLDDLLRDFQARKTHLAIVVDEYGGTAGLVTLEDVLEQIVGDIRDEHDEEPALYRPLEDHRWMVQARINLDDLAEIVGLDLDTDNFDFETLGGLVFHLAGQIPSEGDVYTYKTLRLQVHSVQANRVGEVAVQVDPTAEAVLLAEKRTAEG
jgi:gliding motility-associated protein GldE